MGQIHVQVEHVQVEHVSLLTAAVRGTAEGPPRIPTPPQTRPQLHLYAWPHHPGPVAPSLDSYRYPSVHTRERTQEWVTGCLGLPHSGQGLKLGSQQLPSPSEKQRGQPPTPSCPWPRAHLLLPPIFTKCQVGARPGRSPYDMHILLPEDRQRSHYRRGLAGVIQLGLLRQEGDPG